MRTISLRSALLTVLVVACDGPVTQGDAGVDASAPACTFDPGAPEAIPEPEVHTPRWAFEPWVSKDISDREDSYSFVNGFLERGIPTGVLVIDSPWDSQYTTFTPNPTRYPDFGEMVADMHAMDVRVVMWTTQMVNRNSFDAEAGGDVYRGPAPNFSEGCACGFFVNDCELYGWWKGRGAGVDFFHPGARAWWHRQQDALLDMGIDGWKLDFGESYMEEDATLSTYEGDVAHQAYSEAYYRDFLAYGRHRRGRDFVTMVRPWDVSYDRRGRFHARPEHAPVAWVGDNKRDWAGLIDALDHVLRSAQAGYVVLGSDIGGYLDRDDQSLLTVIPFDLEVFQRWVALGAMMPFMQLHGRANLEPWNVPEPEQTVALYRYWATLHHEMVGFWYSLTEEAYASGGVILHPVGDEAAWPDDYRYVIGEHFLVAPIVEAGGVRDVALPSGARWFDWWTGDVHEGGTTIASYDASEPGRIPLFVREGAILPMNVDSDVTGIGSAASAGHLTVLVWPAAEEHTFRLHEEDDAVTTITATSARLTLSRATAPTVFRVRREAAPSAVTIPAPLAEHADRASFDAAAAGYWHDGASHWLWIKVAASDGPITIDITD